MEPMESEGGPPYTARVELRLSIQYSNPEEVIAEALRRIAEDGSLPERLRERQRETATRNLRFALERALGSGDLLLVLRDWEDGPVRVRNGSLVVWHGQDEEPLAPLSHPPTIEEIGVPETDEVTLRLIRAGRQLPGLNFLSGMYVGEEGISTAGLQAGLRDVAVIKGLMHEGARLAVDGLFEDSAFLERARVGGESVVWEETAVISKLPLEHRTYYDVSFARRFLTVVVDVTAKLAGGWLPLPTVAHEVALQLILDLAEEVQASLDVEAPQDWARDVADYLQIDQDYLMYPDSSPPGIEGDLWDVENWFVPFLLDWHPAPYTRG